MLEDTLPKIMAIGGAGYIGSHCCKAIRKAGYLPVVYDNFSTGHREFVKWGPHIEADVRDKVSLRAAFAQHKVVGVMHFAALALVGESVRDPAKYWEVNVGGTLALLEAMCEAGVDKLVFSSTCAVYGEPQTLPIDETFPKLPVNPYGASKLAAERMMDDFDQAYGLRSVRLRYFNACGADKQLEIGEDRKVETHLIPLILDAAMGRRAAVCIFGHDYPTHDGTAVRDYIHVLDLADAHVLALQHLIEGQQTVAVNLGVGGGASVIEVILAAEQAVGFPVPCTYIDRRPGDPAKLVADASLAKRMLKWQPQRSGLQEILTDAWAWHRHRFTERPIPTLT